MNQRLSPPSHRSRPSVSLFRSGGRSVASGRFLLQVCLRGESGPTCEVLCSGLEEAIQFGQAEFPVFAERNPWIGVDSLQRKIWILLDPETESTHSSAI
jgi:hypothetical protein